MASGNPGNPGFGAWANFSRPARIGPSDSSKCSPAQEKTIGTKISPIRVGREKIWLSEILEIRDFCQFAQHGSPHAPLGSGRVICQSTALNEPSKMGYDSARSERGVGRYGLRESWNFGIFASSRSTDLFTQVSPMNDAFILEGTRYDPMA
ncbi:hypothetical protein DdX_10877 [Ditylenchus destructor]|uniref:Uncharacterized protein n=1 Tax=Ditylenchus destructor TaxID=166010 RepID=A0AAD4QYU7_9BILA|nr:hypothetical protein DdX_10877 [Ditylenchus destructor]